MLGPLPAWGERPGDTAEGSQALWPPHWDISDESGDAAAGSSRALGPALPFSCPRSGSLRSGAAALVLPPPMGSERATGDIGLRFDAASMSVDLLLLPPAHCSLVAFLSHSSGPWVPRLKPWTWEGVPSPPLSHGNDPFPSG